MSGSGSGPALPRGRRSGVTTIVALVALAAAVLGAIAAFQIHAGRDRTVLGDVPAVAHYLRDHDWHDVAVLVAGVVCVAVGALLLLAGVLPARRRHLRLVDLDTETSAGIPRRDLARDLVAVLHRVDGVDRAAVRVRRRRVRVTARSALRDGSGLLDAVREAVTARLAEIDPARALGVRVRIRESRS